ncbi:MAG: zf-HC2 domain-containing protein [Acidimicrobiales bacterium]|jgi:hypothetical protein
MGDEPTEIHERFIEQLPELAAGVLGGRERAVLLGHVTGCPSCTEELDQLMATADSLVLLAAEVDPPVGFESRVIGRLQTRPSNERRHDRWRKRSIVAASAAALVAIAFGLGWDAHSSHQPVRSAVVVPGTYGNVTEASLTSGDRSVGMVAVYSDRDGWLLMTVDSAGYSGSVRCRVTSAHGVTRTVGSFDLTDGRGAWVAPLPEAIDYVRTAELVGTGGRVLATAHFS